MKTKILLWLIKKYKYYIAYDFHKQLKSFIYNDLANKIANLQKNNYNFNSCTFEIEKTNFIQDNIHCINYMKNYLNDHYNINFEYNYEFKTCTFEINKKTKRSVLNKIKKQRNTFFKEEKIIIEKINNFFKEKFVNILKQEIRNNVFVESINLNNELLELDETTFKNKIGLIKSFISYKYGFKTIYINNMNLKICL